MSRPVDADTPLQTPGQTEARLAGHVATDPGFQNLVDTAEVDQATYTVPWGTYPEGPLYWRVRALDGDRNLLPWSDTGEFTKKSPVPVPASPTDGATVNGDTPLSGTRWASPRRTTSRSTRTATRRPPGQPGPRPDDRQRVLTLDYPLAALATDYVWRVHRSMRAASATGGPASPPRARSGCTSGRQARTGAGHARGRRQ